MRRFALSFFLLAMVAAIASGAERDERFSFPVGPGCTLKIDSYRGSVIVVESDEPTIAIAVHLEIGSDTEAEGERMRRGLQLDVNESNNTVTIFARHPSESRVRWVWREDKQIDLTYRIAVPRRCHVDIKLINGVVTVGDLTGRMTARVENGNVSFRRVEGSVDVAVERGDVVISRCLGDVTARVREGSIRTGTITGAANLKNSSGDVELLQANGPVIASAEAGDVIVGFPRSIGGNAQLTSRGGNIVAKIDPHASCRIVASSVWGVVDCRLAAQIESGANRRTRLTARLGTPGPELTLRANGGDVRLEPGETVFE
jgi:hypothetical protein